MAKLNENEDLLAALYMLGFNIYGGEVSSRLYRHQGRLRAAVSQE